MLLSKLSKIGSLKIVRVLRLALRDSFLILRPKCLFFWKAPSI